MTAYFGLFGTDVTTDWVNGYNLIKEEHIIWGSFMCIFPFAPAALVGPVIAFNALERIRKTRVLVILIFYVPGVLLATPVYMMFIFFAGALKLWNPKLPEDDDDTPFPFGLGIEDGNMVMICYSVQNV